MTELEGRNRKSAKLVDSSGELPRCGACFRHCAIGRGGSGFCRTRVNNHGSIETLAYGVVSKISVDPVEDKPLRHFHSGTRCLSVGSFGCNFRCLGCQNASVSWGLAELGELKSGRSAESVFVPADVVVQMAKELCCDGVAFTYNEPAVWLEYVLDVAQLAKKRGLYTVYVTNSTLSVEAIDLLAPHIDAIATDIKSTDDNFYRDLCGAAGALHHVMEGIAHAARKGIHIETRTNVIAGMNDAPEVLRGIASWIKDTLGAESPWHVTQFHPAHNLMHIPATPVATLEMARTIANEVGLRNVYVEARPCDCAQGTLDPEIERTLAKFQRNGVLFSANANQSTNGKHTCSCCSG